MDEALILKEVDEAARKEIEENGTPFIYHYELSLSKAKEISKVLGADEFVASLGAMLMDLKLGEALKQKRLKDHVKMSSDAAYELLMKYDIPKEQLDKIINCIEAHHKQIPFTCIESEICANADCYRFLTLEGALKYFIILTKREMTYEQAIKFAKSKFDEKLSILSLDYCKKDLEEDIKTLSTIFTKTV